MRDMHCHILPGVDDGSRDLKMSLAMVDAARAVGVTSMVCTPHCRDPYFDFEAMWEAFHALRDATDMPLTMGFEVNHAKLVKLGLDEWAPRLGFDGTGEFLLELSSRCTEADFQDYEETIFRLQAMGYQVIIAHPERYRAIQKDVGLAEHLVSIGCKLQASADFVVGGRLGRERRPARQIFERDLYSYIASDAHRPEHYDYLRRARAGYHVRAAHMRG